MGWFRKGHKHRAQDDEEAPPDKDFTMSGSPKPTSRTSPQSAAASGTSLKELGDWRERMDLVGLAHELVPEDAGAEEKVSKHVPDVKCIDFDGVRVAPLVQQLVRLRSASRITLKKLHGSFSGALVLLTTPFRHDEQELPMTIVKVDAAPDVAEEAKKTRLYGPRWGAAYPNVLDVVEEDVSSGNSAVMHIDLCGGRLGVPGLTQAGSVTTMATILAKYMTGKESSELVSRAMNEIGRRLREWSNAQPAEVNLFQTYRTAENIEKRIFNGLDTSIPALGEPSVIAFFRSFLRKIGNGLKVMTTWGTSHNDFHGGNQLVDPMGVVWLIDFATVEDAHGLNDWAKLLMSTLIMYTEADPDEELAFQDLCHRIASVPSLTGGFPRKDAPGSIARLEEVVETMWPQICAMDPAGDGASLSWALLRYGIRMMSFKECNKLQQARGLYLATACAQRLIANTASSKPQWIILAQEEWHLKNLHRSNPNESSEESCKDTICTYLTVLAGAEGWFVDPVSRVKLSIFEASVNVVLEQLEGVMRRPNLTAAPVMLPEGLAETFPRGIPARLLILAEGGMGKSVMTKQIVCSICKSQLTGTEASDASGMTPFRIALQGLAQIIQQTALKGWASVQEYFYQTYGKTFIYGRCLQNIIADRLPALLILDGLDEAQEFRSLVVSWIRDFDELPEVRIVVTSRPAAVESLRSSFAELGFEARRIKQFTEDKSKALVSKILAWLPIDETRKAVLRQHVARKEYNTLLKVPMMTSLLVQVLAYTTIRGGALSRTQLYEHAVKLVVNVDILKDLNQISGGKELRPLLELTKMAFANHLAGMRSQPWESYAGCPQALRSKVESGGIALFEIVGNKVQFSHMSFQEYLTACALAAMISAEGNFDMMAPWLRQRAGEPWWSDALIMLFELLPPEAVGALMALLAADPRCQLQVGRKVWITNSWLVIERCKVVHIVEDGITDLVTTANLRTGRTARTRKVDVLLEASGVGVFYTAACKAGAGTSVLGLLDAGVHPTICDAYGFTVYHSISEDGNDDLLASMCNRVGGSVLSLTARNMTQPIFLIMMSGMRKSWAYRLGTSAIRMESSSGILDTMPLHLAAHRGDIVEVRRLLSEGAEVDAMTPEDGTPLVFAAMQGHVEVVAALVQAEADVNKRVVRTPQLHGNKEIPILHVAMGATRVDVVEALLAYEADVGNRDRIERDAWEHAVASHDQERLAKVLIDSGMGVNHTCWRGHALNDMLTPLHLASWTLDYNTVEFLLQARADMNKRACYGQIWYLRPSQYVTLKPRGKAIIKLFAAHRAELSRPAPFPICTTPLTFVTTFNNVDSIKVLLESRVDPDVRCRVPSERLFRLRTAKEVAAMRPDLLDAYSVLP